MTYAYIPFGPGSSSVSLEQQLFNIKSIIDRQKFLNEMTLRVSRPISPKLLKLNEGNFRQNLLRYTGIEDPGKWAQAHHSCPKSFWEDFAEIGIDVHNPRYGSWWETTAHQRTKDVYNLEWKEFFQKKRTYNEALDKGRILAKKYGFHVTY
jgi:hypothetical protein